MKFPHGLDRERPPLSPSGACADNASALPDGGIFLRRSSPVQIGKLGVVRGRIQQVPALFGHPPQPR